MGFLACRNVIFEMRMMPQYFSSRLVTQQNAKHGSLLTPAYYGSLCVCPVSAPPE